MPLGAPHSRPALDTRQARYHGRRRQAPRETQRVRPNPRRLRRGGHGRVRADQARRLSLRRHSPCVRVRLLGVVLCPVLLRLWRIRAAAVQGDIIRDPAVRQPGQGARLGVHQPVRMLLQAARGWREHVQERDGQHGTTGHGLLRHQFTSIRRKRPEHPCPRSTQAPRRRCVPMARCRAKPPSKPDGAQMLG